MTSETGPKSALTEEDTYPRALGVVMMHKFSLKAGLKKFGDEGKKVVSKELTQLHKKIVYVPVNPDKLAKNQRK